MNRFEILGKSFFIALLLILVAVAIIPVAYVTDVSWLKGVAFGVSVLGIVALLTLLLFRVSQQVLSVRRAVKQAYDRQLSLASFIDRQIKSNMSITAAQVSSPPDEALIEVVNSGYGVDYEYARRLSERQSSLQEYALTTRSLRIRNSIALSASKGRWREQDLTQFFRLETGNYVSDGDRKWHRQMLDPRSLGHFAGVLANQNARPTDLRDADLIYRYIAHNWGFKSLPRYQRLLAIETAMERNGYQGVNGSFNLYGMAGEKMQKHLFAANGAILKSTTEESLRQWLGSVNGIYESEGLTSISLIDRSEEAPSLYDRLDADADYQVHDGPKVTILMPTFNPDLRIYTAIRSILKQTWQNIEVLIIDDGSPVDTRDVLYSIAKLDDRIKLLFLERNRGAYVARNFGLEHAVGEFITVHDDDDWSHPQKIELQVRDLVDHPERVANWNNHVRTTEDLFFMRLNNNPKVTQFNFSSILFRTELIAEIGGWNNVNRSGDSEYKDRIESFTGEKLTSPVEAPMSFTRTGGSSLTQGEMDRGYMDSARRFYIKAYQAAHRKASENQAWGPDLMELPPGVPENLKDSQRHVPLGHFDIIYATDFRFPGGNSSLAVAEIEALVSDGQRVGIIQLDSPVNAPATPVAAPALAMFEKAGGQVAVLSLLDVATSDLLIVRNPSVAQFVDRLETKISVSNLVLIANSTPVLSDGSGQTYSISNVVRNLENLFGVRVQVVAESLVTRGLAELLGDEDLFESVVWPGMVDTRRFRLVDRTPVSQRRPVIGRHSRDSVLKWPEDIATFREIYVQPEIYETRVLGGLEETSSMLESSDLDALEVHDFGTLEPEEFLEELDFWVYFTSDRWKESFGMGIAEAMASGLVVILPETLKSTFGEGAVYCEPSEVVGTIEKFWNSPELYRQQATIAREVCMREFSSAATLARIQKFANRVKAEA